jgi:hypothetical protein
MNKELKSALRYYQQSINATIRGHYKKQGKVYTPQPITDELLASFSEQKIAAAVNTYKKHKDYLKTRRASKKVV